MKTPRTFTLDKRTIKLLGQLAELPKYCNMSHTIEVLVWDEALRVGLAQESNGNHILIKARKDKRKKNEL